MISVQEALDHVLSLVSPINHHDEVPLENSFGRILAQTQFARRTQPPSDLSSMDGYGISEKDAFVGNTLDVIGISAAGDGFSGTVTQKSAIRIFTGAPVPKGVDRIIIQENVEASNQKIILSEPISENTYIRKAGSDFHEGASLPAPRKLSAEDVTLLAAMNIPQIPVLKRPKVAIISNGNELVMPGETLQPDQIIAANAFGVASLIETTGAQADIFPIAKDTENSLTEAFLKAQNYDVIVTIGGASVGDHDLVGSVAKKLGLKNSFYKVAMRPGKPLIAGKLGASLMLGLPGNPVSALMTARLFLCPALLKMQGLAHEPQIFQLPCTNDLPSNGPRAHYMRAKISGDGVECFENQDSAMLSIFSQSDALIIREPFAKIAPRGSLVSLLKLHQ